MLTEPRPRRAVFLDRDGVINEEKSYVYRTEDFEFVEGVFELCRLFEAQGYLLVVVTNQAGIGRGLYTEDDFSVLTAWMIGQFRAAGVSIAAVYYCPFHPQHGTGDYRRESHDRKPNPGMILRARDELGIDLSRSILIGDKESDILAGKTAGVGINVLLVPADSRRSVVSSADFIVATLLEVAGLPGVEPRSLSK